jgi:hypothetical protein
MKLNAEAIALVKRAIKQGRISRYCIIKPSQRIKLCSICKDPIVTSPNAEPVCKKCHAKPLIPELHFAGKPSQGIFGRNL